MRSKTRLWNIVVVLAMLQFKPLLDTNAEQRNYNDLRRPTNLVEQVIFTLVSQPIDAAGGLPATFQAMSHDPALPRDALFGVLMDVVRDGQQVPCESFGQVRKPPSEAPKAEWLEYDRNLQLCGATRNAIWALEILNAKLASGLLADVVRRPASEKYRCPAISAICGIGDTNMLDMARYVVIESLGGRMPSQPRFVLYDRLGRRADDREVLQFLLDAAVTETNFFDEARLVDTILCGTCKQWGNSDERREWLERPPDNRANVLADYWKEQLRAIRALPASERTHVEVHPLRGPAPDLAVTNGPLAPAVEAILKETPSPAPPSAVTNAP